jgi:hypothetical protein
MAWRYANSSIRFGNGASIGWHMIRGMEGVGSDFLNILVHRLAGNEIPPKAYGNVQGEHEDSRRK